MKDLISLFPPCDDLVDPLGSGRREGGDEGFHHTFVELGCLLDENDILLGILRIIDNIDRQEYCLKPKHELCECELRLRGR